MTLPNVCTHFSFAWSVHLHIVAARTRIITWISVTIFLPNRKLGRYRSLQGKSEKTQFRKVKRFWSRSINLWAKSLIRLIRAGLVETTSSTVPHLRTTYDYSDKRFLLKGTSDRSLISVPLIQKATWHCVARYLQRARDKAYASAIATRTLNSSHKKANSLSNVSNFVGLPLIIASRAKK